MSIDRIGEVVRDIRPHIIRFEDETPQERSQLESDLKAKMQTNGIGSPMYVEALMSYDDLKRKGLRRRIIVFDRTLPY